MQNTLNLTHTQWVEINSEKALFLFFGVYVFMRFLRNIHTTYYFYITNEGRSYENA